MMAAGEKQAIHVEDLLNRIGPGDRLGQKEWADLATEIRNDMEQLRTGKLKIRVKMNAIDGLTIWLEPAKDAG